MTNHDDETTPDVSPIESWADRDDAPPVDALAEWDFDPVVVCDWNGCHKDAVRSISYRHGAKPEGCVVPTAELLCQDHANAVRKAAKNRADAERRCNHCGDTPTEYFDIIATDELL